MGERWIDIGMGNGVQESALRASPYINWRHIDGPLMSWAGHCHWLTLRERVLLWIGRETPEGIARKRWPLAVAWIPASPPRPVAMTGRG